jgi:hypothetical protein
MSIPERLLHRLDDLGVALSRRSDAIALIALGSVGVDRDRLDDHSDLDFFVIVEAAAQRRYIDSIDWLEEVSPLAFSFPNTVHGRKALFADGLFAEYAVFTLEELAADSFSPGRIVWQRAGAPADLAVPKRVSEPLPHESAEYYVNEALTNLYVGLHREARGETLSATRFIQSYAVDCLIALLGALHPEAKRRQDAFAVERGVERRFATDLLPLSTMVLGYERNREAALTILEWLEAHADVDPVLAAAIRELADLRRSSSRPG